MTISTSTFFDGLLVTGLYTSTSVQASQSVGGSSAFGFGKSGVIHVLQPGLINTRSSAWWENINNNMVIYTMI